MLRSRARIAQHQRFDQILLCHHIVLLISNVWTEAGSILVAVG